MRSASPRRILLAARGDRAAEDLDAAPRVEHAGRDRQRREWDGLQHLEGGAHDHRVVAPLSCLQDGAEERSGRTAVLRVGAPRPAGELGRDVAAAVTVEEGIERHG